MCKIICTNLAICNNYYFRSIFLTNIFHRLLHHPQPTGPIYHLQVAPTSQNRPMSAGVNLRTCTIVWTLTNQYCLSTLFRDFWSWSSFQLRKLLTCHLSVLGNIYIYAHDIWCQYTIAHHNMIKSLIQYSLILVDTFNDWNY